MKLSNIFFTIMVFQCHNTQGGLISFLKPISFFQHKEIEPASKLVHGGLNEPNNILYDKIMRKISGNSQPDMNFIKSSIEEVMDSINKENPVQYIDLDLRESLKSLIPDIFSTVNFQDKNETISFFDNGRKIYDISQAANTDVICIENCDTFCVYVGDLASGFIM